MGIEEISLVLVGLAIGVVWICVDRAMDRLPSSHWINTWRADQGRRGSDSWDDWDGCDGD